MYPIRRLCQNCARKMINTKNRGVKSQNKICGALEKMFLHNSQQNFLRLLLPINRIPFSKKKEWDAKTMFSEKGFLLVNSSNLMKICLELCRNISSRAPQFLFCDLSPLFLVFLFSLTLLFYELHMPLTSYMM